MKILKWLFLLVLLISAAAGYLLLQEDSGPEVAVVTETKSEIKTEAHPEAEASIQVIDQENSVYTNVRFGFSLKFPHTVLSPQDEADNGDGQTFISKDGLTRLVVSASNNALSETLEDEFKNEQEGGSEQSGDRQIVYKKMQDNWYEISGMDDNALFYVKRYLIDDVFVGFEISYPQEQQAQWEKVIQQLNKDFNPDLPVATP